MFECQTDALGIEVKILFASKRLQRKARPEGECPIINKNEPLSQPDFPIKINSINS